MGALVGTRRLDHHRLVVAPDLRTGQEAIGLVRDRHDHDLAPQAMRLRDAPDFEAHHGSVRLLRDVDGDPNALGRAGGATDLA